MARITLTNTFVLIPEGTHIFRIYDATYNEKYGKIEVRLVNAQGLTHTERFSIKKGNGEVNEGALGAFSYFAKTALQDYSRTDIDPAELIDHYIAAEVHHNKVASTKKEGEFVTFVNLGDKSEADGFDEKPVPRALTLGKKESRPPNAKQESPTQTESTGFDLDALLG